MESHIDIEKTRKIVALAAEKVKSEVDPWLLEEYHSLFKKEVSLFNRTKVAAYLLMLLEQGKPIRALERDSSRQKTQGRNAFAARPEREAQRRPKGEDHGSDPNRYPLADKDSKWLFFSIGRSRRLSPREILSLVNTKTAIAKEDIGAIRIFDNYSFVQVRDIEAEKIIEALHGYVFRGRPLTVNHAKSRKDEGEEAYAEPEAVQDCRPPEPRPEDSPQD